MAKWIVAEPKISQPKCFAPRRICQIGLIPQDAFPFMELWWPLNEGGGGGGGGTHSHWCGWRVDEDWLFPSMEVRY